MEECPVCYEVLDDSKIKLKCGHIFHLNCLLKLENYTCPMCREIFHLSDFGVKLPKICYENHIFGYSPHFKNGPCRFCHGIPKRFLII